MKHVVLLSGGLDSTVLLAKVAAEHPNREDILPIAFDYGQRHTKELLSAYKVCNALYIKSLRVADLRHIAKFFMQGSSQTDDIPVPYGHYTDESMKVTVVPNRNMIMLAIATAYTIQEGGGIVYIAVHAGDHTIYPDCRAEFIACMEAAIRLCDWKDAHLRTPFLALSKADIVKLGRELGAPLYYTWSCYEGNYLHCGKCGTCVERKEAFKLAGVDDPTEYEA